MNDGSGVFTLVDGGNLTNSESWSRDVVVGDFDGDGNLDVYEACGSHYTAMMNQYKSNYLNRLFMNDGNMGFVSAVGGDATLFEKDTTGLTVGDFDGDGLLDVGVGAYGASSYQGQISLFFNDNF